MNVLILHGILGSAGENWGQWLHDELEAKSYNVTMPTLSNADHPDRDKWHQEISGFMEKLGPKTIIVAHSLSVTSVLDCLEADNKPIKALVSVSGFSGDYGLELNSYFLKQNSIDFTKVNSKIEKAFVIFGDNDPYVPQQYLLDLAKNLNVRPAIIPKGGHLNSAAGFSEFPLLLDTVLSI
jgi:uncharacterized protein